MSKKNTVSIQLPDVISEALDQASADSFPCMTRAERRWILRMGLIEGILAIAEWKRHNGGLFEKPFRLVAVPASGYRIVQMESAAKEADKVIDAFLAAATEDYERMKQEGTKP